MSFFYGLPFRPKVENYLNDAQLRFPWSSVSQSWWGGVESLICVFIPSVTQRNEDAGSVKVHLVVLVWIKIIRRLGESKTPLCNSSGGNILLRASVSCNKLLGRVAFRILPNIYNGASPQKITNSLRHWLFPQKSTTADVNLDSKYVSEIGGHCKCGV